MGADFITYVPDRDSPHSAFGYIGLNRLKLELINMVDPGIGEIWDRDIHSRDFDAVVEALYVAETEMDGDDEAIARGVRYFVDCSDCDGVYYNDGLEEIVMALEHLRDSGKSVFDLDDIIAQFTYARDNDGMIVIM